MHSNPCKDIKLSYSNPIYHLWNYALTGDVRELAAFRSKVKKN